ncbi:MAG: hypothetical protein AAGE94_00495 [Acidobacteriota bacterium]
MALLLVVASIVAYFVLATRYAVFQAVPWVHLLVAAGACVWLAIDWRRHAGKGRLAALVVAVVLTAFYTWYTLDLSSYRGETPPSFAVGDQFADLRLVELPDASGNALPLLGDGTARATLIVFYRGFW